MLQNVPGNVMKLMVCLHYASAVRQTDVVLSLNYISLTRRIYTGLSIRDELL